MTIYVAVYLHKYYDLCLRVCIFVRVSKLCVYVLITVCVCLQCQSVCVCMCVFCVSVCVIVTL